MDDMDIEAMLDAPLEKKKPAEVSEKTENESAKKSKKHKKSSRSKSRSPSKKRRSRHSKSRSKSKDKKSSSSSRKKSKSKRGSRPGEDSSRHRKRSRDRKGRRSRSRSSSLHWRFGGAGGGDGQAFGNRGFDVEIPPEERDKRTVFCMQLHTRLRARDLEEFFSQVGKVRDVRIISDRNSRRCKGIAYIEFFEEDSVPPALKLSGTKIMGIPIQVQHTQAEKNRAAMLANLAKEQGPTRLYVGSLHCNITETMLRAIFEPFGYIDTLQLMIDPETNRSRGYGFVQYREAESARRAKEQLNGFELAGKPIKVGEVTEKMDHSINMGSALDDEETERGGIEMNANARVQLMAKLANGNQLRTKQQKAQAAAEPDTDIGQKVKEMFGGPTSGSTQPPTECFMLRNMFDPTTETDPYWSEEIRSDVIGECSQFGGVVHIHVDKGDPNGCVYLKAVNASIASACVNSLQGRWFSGKMIKAAYMTVSDYSKKFEGTEYLRHKLER